MSEPNPTKEYSAGIEPPEAFDASTFRSIDLAPGVRAVIGRRPGKDTTEIQSIRFATKGRHSFDADMAKAWLRRNGYRWITWGSPFRKKQNNADDSTARLHVTEAAAHLDEAQAALAAPTPNRCAPAATNAPTNPTISDDVVDRLDEQFRGMSRSLALAAEAMEHISEQWSTIRRPSRNRDARQPNAPDLGGLILASAITGRALSDAAAKHNPETPAPAPTPGVPVAERIPNPPAPRQLVQIGTARELELKSGRGYKWTVDERWLVLADPGAEKGSRGRIRLFIVSPKGKKPSPRDPHQTSDRTFKTWHAFESSRTWSLDVPLADEFTTTIGDAASITYRSDKWQPGKPVDYVHAFSKQQLPRVSAVGPADKPRALMVDGGRFRLTARGLVD